MTNFSDLETKGFVVIKKFLPDSLIELVREDYQRRYQQPSGYKNKNYHMFTSDDWNFRPWIEPIIDAVKKTTRLNINCIMPGTAYFNNRLIDFEWHQDHECFYSWQEMLNAINCWIPIIKDDPRQSGIDIIPHDVLVEKYPDFFRTHVVGQGAKKFFCDINGFTCMRDDYHGIMQRLPLNLDDLSLTPEVGVGDMLIIRQDIIHRTQDTVNDRVAISIRCRNSNSILTRSHFLKSCSFKDTVINNNLEWYDRFKEKFEQNDQILIKDILESL